MSGRLPPRIEALIEEVLDASGLGIAEGREEVRRELRAHFEDGLSAGTAEETLIDRFGDPEAAGRRISKARPKERGTRARMGRWWTSPVAWWAELRRAALRLGRAPGFVAVVVLTLGLGVGANTAIFTVLDGVLLEELPYAEPDRLVRVYEGSVEDPTRQLFLRAPVLSEYRSWDEVFESLAASYTYRELGADLTDGDVPRRVIVVRASAGYFETLGVAPQLGRTFLENESFGPGEATSTSVPGAPVTVLSHRLWTDQFGGAPDVVGRTVHLDELPFEVVGVMPADFRDPFGSQADAWIPQDLRQGGSNSFGNFYLSSVARLREGVTIEAARDRVQALSAAFAEAQPDVEGSLPAIVPLQDDVVGSTLQAMLWLLAGAAGLVLLTACVNVANLVFARGLEQDRDLALRAALGSGRSRLIVGMLAENALLAALGGVFGLVVGRAGLAALTAVAPDVLPGVTDVEIGGRVFFFALVLTAAAMLVFGLAPALRLSGAAPADVLRSGDRASTVGRRTRRLRDGLVVVQVGAALVLVAGATLLARSFDALTDVPLGVDAERVLTFEVNLPQGRYLDGAARHAFHEQLHERVRELPGVTSVGATSWLPVNGRYHSWTMNWNPDNPGEIAEDGWQGTDVRIIAGDYFRTMGIELLSGASPADVDYAAEPVAWVSESLAELVWPDEDPVGVRIWLNGPRRVVGVVEDVAHDTRGERYREIYMPHAQYNDDRNWALIQVVGTRGDPAELLGEVRQAIASLDGQLVLYKPRSFDDVLSTARVQDRFATVLMGSFAGLALLLALVGLYGVLAGSVVGRTREIGIRMALGADAGQVRGMVLGYAAALLLPGLALGLLGAWIGSRWIESLLYGVGVTDPVAYVGAITVFLVVGALSAWLPAERAAHVDTVQSLSAE